MQGGFATLFDVHPDQCHPLPMPSASKRRRSRSRWRCASTPWAAPVASRRAKVLVTGAGPIGLLTALAARHEGRRASPSPTSAPLPSPSPNRWASRRAARTSCRRARSTSRSRPRARPASTAPCGGAAGRHGGADRQSRRAAIPFAANMLVAKELDLKGSQRFGSSFARALELIQSGAIDPTAIVGGRFGAARGAGGLRERHQPGPHDRQDHARQLAPVAAASV